MLEKESYPRDKYCGARIAPTSCSRPLKSFSCAGDAVCTPAINILREMGVMQELVLNDEAHFAVRADRRLSHSSPADRVTLRTRAAS